MARLLLLFWLLALSACAAPVPLPSPLPDVVLLGEQHDEPEHQQLHRQTIELLAGRGQLAALALEMAEQGRSTAALARDASEAQVKAALDWDDKAWPWAAYGPAVMVAVGAGVPVLGANLPTASLREAMADPRLDGTVSPAVLQAQQEAVRDGHCGLLPASQLRPMTRVQIARDETMARVLADAARPGQTVVLVTGAGHADPKLGVPLHLAGTLQTYSRIWPAGAPKKDYCESLKRQLDKGQPHSSDNDEFRRLTSSDQRRVGNAPQAFFRIESASVFTSVSMCDFSTM